MATFKGNDGVVKIGSDSMAEVISFTVDQTAEVIEDKRSLEAVAIRPQGSQAQEESLEVRQG
jgi:hypothetical protein